jgi:hypothetical protein
MNVRRRTWSRVLLPALALLILEAPAASAATPFALLELFTSEGCSSCPAADRLLAETAAAAQRDGRHVLALEFHVDYWNHLGWKDPFSDPSYSRRQSAYAEAFHLNSLYTPQLVVNGREEFVGSDRNRTASAIRAALTRPASVSLALRSFPAVRGTSVDFTVTRAPANAVVCVALVDSSDATRVNAGENAGRTLVHTGVVRAFASTPIAGAASGRLTLPPVAGRTPARPHLVGWVEDGATLTILGVATD